MHVSLSWIEWFDRLDRVLTSARHDVAAVADVARPRATAAVEQSTRQLSGLLNTLHLLDSDVVATDCHTLRAALDTAVLQLGTAAELRGDPAPVRERRFTAIDSALRDVGREAAALLRPRRRRA